LAQRIHVTPCNPAQSKGKPEQSRFSEVLMTFGNRFVAERCGNMAATAARTTGPPGAPSPLHRCEPDHGPGRRLSLMKDPPPTSKEVI
jgi:hypothetical protein